MILLDAAAVEASRPGRHLFADLSLTVSSGDRMAVVGINGGGKSTLLRVLAGAESPESGVVRRGRGARVVLLSQVDDLPAGSVRQAVGEGWEASAALDRLGLSGLVGADVATLSGGEVKRVALARALVELGPPGGDDDAVLLLLDEPTNHLDVDAIAWLEDRLCAHRGGLVLVTHDRHVLDRVTTRILELDRGRTFLHDGGYASWLEAQVERRRQADRAEDVRRNLARDELAWLRRGAPARTAKPKARIATATALVEARPEAAARKGELDLSFGTPRLGDKVVALHGVGHRFDPNGGWLFRGVDLDIGADERLGIIGPNGAGKSTLLDVMAGRLEPTEGTVEMGPTVRLGVYDQRGRDLDLTARVRDAVAGPHRQPDWEDARFLERFWFDGDAQWAPIGLLSGGERRRLQLVLTLRAKPNVLFLDEPTNDLDLDTLRTLEDVLENWPGAVVVVSHDRAFLERTITDVVVADEGQDIARRPGGYAGWDATRRRRPAAVTRTDTPVSARAAGPSSRGDGRSPSTLRQLLKKVERDLAGSQRRRDELLAALADAGHDHRAHAELGTQLTAVQAEVDAAEERWLELSVETG